MKTTKKVEAARKLMDWLATPEAMALFAKNFAVVAIPGIAKPLEFVPANYEQLLVKNDFAWEARIATRSWRTGPSATTENRNPSNSAATRPGPSGASSSTGVDSRIIGKFFRSKSWLMT